MDELGARCAATRRGVIDQSITVRCKKRATHGEWCRMHAQSLGGWVLVKPEVGFKYGQFHRRAVELTSLLADAAEVQRTGCNHAGIGRPGCVVCDPRVRDALGSASAEAATLGEPHE